MNSTLHPLALILAIALSSASSLHAATKKEAAPSPTPEVYQITHSTTHALPFSGKIFSVDAPSNSFTTENKQKQTRTYVLATGVQVTRDNAPVALEAIKIGEEVRGMAIPKGEGQFEILNATLGTREAPKPLVYAIPTPTPAVKSTPRPTATPKPKSSPPKPKPSPTPAASTPAPVIRKAIPVTRTPVPPKN